MRAISIDSRPFSASKSSSQVQIPNSKPYFQKPLPAYSQLLHNFEMPSDSQGYQCQRDISKCFWIQRFDQIHSRQNTRYLGRSVIAYYDHEAPWAWSLWNCLERNLLTVGSDFAAYGGTSRSLTRK